MGMTADPAPCNALAKMRTAMSDDSAHNIEPRVIIVKATRSIFFLPNMSASRPKMGVTTAPTSSVTVTSQDTAVRPAPVKCGNSGSSER